MEIKHLKEDKNDMEIELDNSTIAELLRVYMARDDDVALAAWKKEHPAKNPVLKIKTKGKSAKKALQDAVSSIEKDLDRMIEEFKKAK